MKHIIIHTLEDSISLLPFLFIAFLFIEAIEHKFSKKSKQIISKSGKFGPLFGSILGCFPQCGFSVMATNLYVTRIISLGTLISVYLSTSDEMLPILLSEQVAFSTIAKLLLIKLAIGMFSGFIIDLVLFRNKNKTDETFDICDDEHCHCEKGILKSSLVHTIKTFLFIVLVTLVLNLVIHYIGEDNLATLLQGNNIFTPFISSLIGLIPNCASSVILTELFVNNIISVGALIAGLLTGSGIAILVLFKTNNNLKDSFKILLMCYGVGVLSGLIIDLIGFTI